MPKRARLVAAFALCGLTAFGVSACGSSGGGGGGGGGGSSSVTHLYGTAPDSLDPGSGYTTQAIESDAVAYTPLLTYAHKGGKAGSVIIPGVAESLPTVSKDGLTYTFTLRKGLKYSNGKPLKASDIPFAIQRSIKISWGGKSFFTSNIKGAAAYDSGKASSISGIKADDATGKVTFTLDSPYGAFPNVLAFPAAAPVPQGTPMKNLPANPPPGIGPYMIADVVPNQSWTIKKNPQWAKNPIPGIPSGNVDTFNAKIQSNTNAEAQQVLSNQADVFDPGDTLPPALIQQIQSTASDRFAKLVVPSTFYFFLNTTTKPFNDIRARQAVNYAMDKQALVKLASGFLKPGCFFIPEGIVGHPTGPCPYYGSGGDPNGKPDLAKARALIKQAGLTGTPVTVYGETRQPRQQYVTYYTSVLNSIGFKATPKILADNAYFPTIGNAHTNPQTGFADWVQDFPNPTDFYLLNDCKTIQPVNNENFSKVCDPHIQSELKALNPVPATKLQSVGPRWEALDKYFAQKAYIAAYGSELFPLFFSNKLVFDANDYHPVFQLDYTAIKLK
jgi:peptide/nickel transport system substrate-binding protein